jgi:hypothetical protein
MINSQRRNTERLEFNVYSGGTVFIELDRCVACPMKGCIEVCQVQGGPLRLDEATGAPGLAISPTEIERGKCNECLGCELECQLSGCQAITILLPIAGFVEALSFLAARGEPCPS